MQQLKRGALLGLALVSCPCHAPILLALLAGTGAGAVLAAHSNLLFAALLLIFLGAIAAWLRTERRPQEAACPHPTAPQPSRHRTTEQEQRTAPVTMAAAPFSQERQ